MLTRILVCGVEALDYSFVAKILSTEILLTYWRCSFRAKIKGIMAKAVREHVFYYNFHLKQDIAA